MTEVSAASNGESNGVAAIAESDETSPAKRSRSAEAEDEEEAAGKRVKLGGESACHHTGRSDVADLIIENELVSETQ